MLVLSRQLKQALRVGDNIEISVLKIENDQVKLGIKAPANVEILRKEIYESIQLENNKAAEQHIDLVALFSQEDHKKNNRT